MNFVRIDHDSFINCPDISIDYAVMEKTLSAAVIPLNTEWSDIGSWAALWDIHEKDSCGNVLKGEVLIKETHNCYIHAENRLITTIGVDNLAIIDTKDAILIIDKKNSQDVKEIVKHIKDHGRTEHINHQNVYRPWGVYESIDSGDRYQVKRITVNPGAKLSVQMHHHRAEHWIVVKGSAKVTNGEKTYLITENQSTYIPVGQIHSLENPGVIPLELIEVQSGSYLGEDDIVRLQDNYGRS
jgi:Mannose-1-phosphate guanylyltransferase